MLVRRPILVATIGYGIGIIGGLCFSFSIILFYLLLGSLYGIKQLCKNRNLFFSFTVLNKKSKFRYSKSSSFHFISYRRCKRYIRLVITRQVFFLIVVSSLFSNTLVLRQNQVFSQLQDKFEKNTNLELSGIIISSPHKKQNIDEYVFQTKDQSGKIFQFALQVPHRMSYTFSYGDELKLQGEYRRPEKQRNEGGFQEELWRKQRKELGTIVLQKYTILAHEKGNTIVRKIHQIKEAVKKRANDVLDEPIHSLFLAMIMGDTNDLNDEQKENFKNAGIYHILAVSGMHMGIIIWIAKSALNGKLGKNKTYAITIICVLFYSLLTGNSPSIKRATIMSMLSLFSFFLHRKNDVWNSLAISLLWIWIDNPYSITHIGLQLSYGGTIGILCFSRPLLQTLKKIGQEKKRLKQKKRRTKKRARGIINGYLYEKTSEILAVTLSAQFMLFPCLLFHFNCITPYFWLSNFFLSFIIIPTAILGFLLFFTLLLSFSMANFIAFFFSLAMKLILAVTQIAKLPFAKIYVVTPTWSFFLIYALFLFFLYFLFRILATRKLTTTQKRLKNTLALFRFRYRQKQKTRKKVIGFIFIGIFIFILICPYVFSSSLCIHFIDVGQGDCTFIRTPQNHTILIDGGGSLGTFDVGKNTVIPYLLDHQCIQIDSLIISHFDQDHCRADC